MHLYLFYTRVDLSFINLLYFAIDDIKKKNLMKHDFVLDGCYEYLLYLFILDLIADKH